MTPGKGPIAAFTLAIILSSIPAMTSAFSVEADEKFEIVILRQDWYDLKLGYSYAHALPLLKAAKEGGSLFVIRTSDIGSYNWPQQSITLTDEASARLIRALPGEDELKEPVKAMNTTKKRFGWGNRIEAALHLKGFLVMLGGDPLYAGIFLEPMSQMAIRYPVIRPRMTEDHAVLCLLPVQMPFLTCDPAGNKQFRADDFVAPEGARDWAHFPEEMKSRIIGFGTTPEAQEFRTIMKNSRVRQIMKDAGKLVE